MELQELIGKSVLDAVDFGTESRKRWSDEYESCEVCRFRLNGTVYLAVEDPEDGYRSCMRELVVDNNAELSNVFPMVEVVGVHRTKYEYGGTSDILELIDAHTGKVVLEVGTENTDDYYPSFVASFHPENMILNAA